MDIEEIYLGYKSIPAVVRFCLFFNINSSQGRARENETRETLSRKMANINQMKLIAKHWTAQRRWRHIRLDAPDTNQHDIDIESILINWLQIILWFEFETFEWWLGIVTNTNNKQKNQIRLRRWTYSLVSQWNEIYELKRWAKH